ncbi:hypothetical protein BG53_00905 [Paenibacillus darwinianus]|uniref:Uncharacterized protein n=1 Tax=Paenibacillus darwinianus TaxID=1380763 RepID=A0A9W5W7S8_9BACL|nr:hypothetical protein [Paenibacillus darwinianus]EXX88239.1 hypothetical protein CH50_03785 [Paenibacillus darwinianus]EXX89014.1 hypothetical protein BG53_00905 [Paenibacillus darwinianus]EXX89428.1 hypothetical protein BG52_15535 [Paenibacillus darwinianus]
MKKVLVCFVDNIENDDNLEHLLTTYEHNDFDVYVLNGICENGTQPHHLTSILESVCGERLETDRLYFLSNLEKFLWLVHGIYHQTFEQI